MHGLGQRVGGPGQPPPRRVICAPLIGLPPGNISAGVETPPPCCFVIGHTAAFAKHRDAGHTAAATTATRQEWMGASQGLTPPHSGTVYSSSRFSERSPSLASSSTSSSTALPSSSSLACVGATAHGRWVLTQGGPEEPERPGAVQWHHHAAQHGTRCRRSSVAAGGGGHPASLVPRAPRSQSPLSPARVSSTSL